MAVRKGRLTLGRLMAAIGIVALGFAMSRVDATPAVSFCVFAGCTWYLGVRRYDEAMVRAAAEGSPVGPGRKVRIAARSVIGSAIAIGLPDAAFLGGYHGYMAAARMMSADRRWSPELEPQQILFGALIGIAAALYVAAMMRRGLRPAGRKRAATPADRSAPGAVREDDRVAASWVSAS